MNTYRAVMADDESTYTIEADYYTVDSGALSFFNGDPWGERSMVIVLAPGTWAALVPVSDDDECPHCGGCDG